MDNNLEDTFLIGLEKNQQKLFRICSVFSADSDDAKDLYQEVLINIWQSMPSFQFKSSIGTWMFRITLNICLRFRSNRIKRQNRFINLDSIVMGNFMNDENSNQNNRLILLRNCVKNLKEGDKAIITLYLEELPYKDISEITGLSENYIAVKVKRIKNKLFNCINKRS